MKKKKIKNKAKITALFMSVLMMLFTFVCPVSAAATQTHSYYKNVPKDGAALADLVAQNIATGIMTNPAYTTDLQRVSAAAAAVKSYKDRGVYLVDENKYYRSPYGVFVAGVYTCAGTTRAMGRVLDYMGIPYIHKNENQWKHQWNVLVMDGQVGFADGMAGIAGYGDYHSGYMTPDGRTFVFTE